MARTKPRQEQRARENVERQGRECYAPQTHESVITPKRVRVCKQALFRSYIFVRIRDGVVSFLRSTYGVADFLRTTDGRPAEVPDEVIAELKEPSRDSLIAARAL